MKLQPRNALFTWGVFWITNKYAPYSGESIAQKVVARISNLLDRNNQKILSGALVQCHFDYACTSWYTGISMGIKKKLQTSQNKLVGVILKLHPRTHLLPAHFTNLGWLRVEERVSQFKMCLVHRIRSNVAPNYFCDYFNKVSDTHSH